MFKFVAQLFISRSADDGRPLPRWVQRQLQRDPELAAYDRACRELVCSLRRDAEAWTNTDRSVDTSERSVGRNRDDLVWVRNESRVQILGRSLKLAGILTLGAAALIVIFSVEPILRTPAKRGQVVVHRNDDGRLEGGRQAGVDLKPVVASWAAGEEVARKLSTGVRKLWSQMANQPSLTSIMGRDSLASDAGGRIRQIGQDLNGNVKQVIAAIAKLESEAP